MVRDVLWIFVKMMKRWENWEEESERGFLDSKDIGRKVFVDGHFRWGIERSNACMLIVHVRLMDSFGMIMMVMVWVEERSEGRDADKALVTNEDCSYSKALEILMYSTNVMSWKLKVV